MMLTPLPSSVSIFIRSRCAGHSITPLGVMLGDVVERPLADEKAVDRIVGEPRLHAEDVRQMSLRIEVDAERTRGRVERSRPAG